MSSLPGFISSSAPFQNPAHALGVKSIATGSAVVRALVVDDERFTRLILSKAVQAAFKHQPLEIVEASNPAQARAFLREQDFSLMVTDDSMPEPGQGVALLRDLKAGDIFKRNRETVRVMASANDFAAKEAQDQDAQFVLKDNRLLSTLKQVLAAAFPPAAESPPARTL